MSEAQINRYWKRIVNTMNDGLMIIGTDGTVISVNRAFERITGYSAADVVGRSCTLLQCDGCDKMISSSEASWCALFENFQDVRCHCRLRTKDGRFVAVVKNATLLVDDEGRPLGAVETLTDMSEVDRLGQEVDRLARQLDEAGDFHGLVGCSVAMQHVFDVIRRAAGSSAPVIIFGESGTGKELVANAIHRIGPRREGPFMQLNCAALNEALLESELFGHIRGAFTGAYRHRTGRFEAADRGDIFLDEIGDMPPALQVKLLRVLETGRFERVGDHAQVRVNVRIISATHQDLHRAIAEGRFREDLFYRINALPIHLPPLRQRREDIPLLVEHFLPGVRQRSGKTLSGLTRQAMERLMGHHWPGNVRELKSVLEYAAIITDASVIDLHHLPSLQQAPAGRFLTAAVSVTESRQGQREALIDALRATGGNQTRAAALLGITRTTVWNRIRKYGIEINGFRSEGQ
jgi:two-component system, NtrC family, response regulator HydG